MSRRRARVATPAADRRLVTSLSQLGVEAAWPPLHQLELVLAVLGGEDMRAACRRSRHRVTTVTRWVDAYNDAGKNAFFVRPENGKAPRGATVEGMLSGRLVEDVWALRTRGELPDTLRLVDARDQDPDPGWDFEVLSEHDATVGFTVDVKLHSAVFRESQKYTGLAPLDCVPLGIYKMLVARERQRKGWSHHVYAFAFRPGLTEELMAVLDDALDTDERAALDLLFATQAAKRKGQQRRAVATVVDRALDLLAPLLDQAEFKVLSTRRAASLFLENVETRAPMLRGKGQGFGSTINMHYSWRDEFTDWTKVLGSLNTKPTGVMDDFGTGRI